MNRFITKKLSNAGAATNNNNKTTGITGERWIGCNPNDAGVLRNLAANDGIVFSDDFVEEQESIISKIVGLKMPATLRAGQENFIQIPLSALGFSTEADIIGFQTVGISGLDVDPATTAYSISYSYIGAAHTISRVRDSLIVEVPNGHQGDLQNKVLNVIVYYK